MNTTAAIYARLVAAPSVTDLIDTFSDLPAVFDDQAPDDYLPLQDKPCIVIAAPVSAEAVETFTEEGQAITRDLRVYAKRSGSVAELDALCEIIRGLFHNNPADLTVAGAKTVICQASGPTASPTTDPSLVGRRISLRLELERI